MAESDNGTNRWSVGKRRGTDDTPKQSFHCSFDAVDAKCLPYRLSQIEYRSAEQTENEFIRLDLFAI